MRPLDRLPSIKLKLGAVILSALAVTFAVVAFGSRWDLTLYQVVPVALALSLATVQGVDRRRPRDPGAARRSRRPRRHRHPGPAHDR